MPDESCRTCGGDLIKWSACSNCRKTTQRICRTCCLKTAEDFHFHHMSLESYQILETKNKMDAVHTHYNPVKVQKPRKNHHNVNHVSNILVLCGIITGVIILSISGTSYFESSYAHNLSDTKAVLFPVQQNMAQAISEPYHASIVHVSAVHSSDDVRPTYSNCLGMANGISLTITCPTTYGSVYKAVVDIPSGLISQFENKAFNLRELSIIEHVDSISIQYEKRTYEAKFVNS
jgi:hypothetical protein